MDLIVIKRHKAYSWTDVYNAWHTTIAQRNTFPSPLFEERHIKYTPGRAITEKHDFIWPQANRQWQAHMALQKCHNENQYASSAASEYHIDKDVYTTITLLWRYRHDIEKTAAVLIMASLAPYVMDRTSDYPAEKWLPYREIRPIIAQAAALIGANGIGSLYSKATCRAMPSQGQDLDRMILFSPLHMAITLADLHITILNDNRPTRIIYTKDGDPSILALLREEQDRQQEEYAKYQRKMDEQQKKEEQKRRDCPLYGQWPAITKDQLEKLVFEKSALKIAAMYGVSDVAVAKKCARMNITKPGIGYWAKMAARKKSPNGRQGDK